MYAIVSHTSVRKGADGLTFHPHEILSLVSTLGLFGRVQHCDPVTSRPLELLPVREVGNVVDDF